MNTLAQKALSAGITLVGGIVVGAGLGYSAPALAGAGLAAAGCVVWAITMWDKKRLAGRS